MITYTEEDLVSPGEAANWTLDDWDAWANQLGLTERRKTAHNWAFIHPTIRWLRFGLSTTPGDRRAWMNAMQDARIMLRRGLEMKAVVESTSKDSLKAAEADLYQKIGISYASDKRDMTDEEFARMNRVLNAAERYNVDLRAAIKPAVRVGLPDQVSGVPITAEEEIVQFIRNSVRLLRERQSNATLQWLLPYIEDATDAAREHQEKVMAAREAERVARSEARAAARKAKENAALTIEPFTTPITSASKALASLESAIASEINSTQQKLAAGSNELRRLVQSLHEMAMSTTNDKALQEAEVARDAAEAAAEASAAAAASAALALRDARDELAEYEKLFSDSVRLNKLASTLTDLVPKLQVLLSRESYLELATGVIEARRLLDETATLIKDSSNA